ncbi:putative cell wall biogenesis protein Mhp1 [Aspergillus taichungensis]|uniref:Putative cell wall biogenesis protein Mhp1 n=1 Tax=Aspergillus taichungensis TaxID=482145 RepID=A0A2J5HKW8_9EURO|nr:putative cell wall biogenesis protein Mhp1 [Aspergillus taichungensis]
MEGVETVDVSWLHHTQRADLSRCRSASSTVSDKSSNETEAPPTSQPRTDRTVPVTSNSPPPAVESPASVTQPKSIPSNAGARVENGGSKDEGAEDARLSASTLAPQKSSPRQIGRRNSWISSLSSKFSSGSTPPSSSSMRAPATPKASAPLTKLDTHNPFGAAYSPRDQEEEKSHEPLVSTSPKSPSFLTNAFRKLSSSASSGSGRAVPNGVICQRRVMNIDQGRDRCKIPTLDQGKLRRVAFCVDVEIAGVSRRESDEGSPPASSKRRLVPEITTPKLKRSNSKSKDKDEAAALKHPEAAVANQGPTSSESPLVSPEAPSCEVKITSEGREPTRKQEKKKRSEEERRERRDRRRRQAEANGSVPLQLNGDDPDDDSRVAEANVGRPKAQSHPTTDPVRIYRRCCQLRETPVLKRVVDEISSPSSVLAESPGTVGVLDLSNFPMAPPDVVTFCDWLAVVPVRKLILEKCALTDTSVRSILAALLSTKTTEQMRQRRRRTKKPAIEVPGAQERNSVVEKLSLKDNPKIGREGWRYICLFIHLSKSLKAIDLSGIPFPKPPVAASGPGENTNSSPGSAVDIASIFASSLAERFGGDHLEELLLSECKPATEDVKKICEAAATAGLRRLGFANNNLTREGLEHVVRYCESSKCEGLDLGGNPIRDHLDLLVSAIGRDHPLYALSLADCALTPSTIHAVLQALTRLPNLRFIDFSHNPGLFSGQPDALALFRRFLPKMHSLKRIHLADVNLSADHVIALAEIIPESPSLCHLNILENPSISVLASATDPRIQEEACAVYASLMAAVRVSGTIIAVDIQVPSAENNEVVKALASQIVAYCLQNLERGAIGALEADISEPADSARASVPIPEILQHFVGADEPCEEEMVENEPAADEDYVIGGTGVVKALGVCLGNLDQHMPGDQSGPPSGTTTPRHRASRSLVQKRPRDMSKNLLASARNIRTRIQSALVREDRAGNDDNYRRLQFLDFTLDRMIKRFEDEYPETRISPQFGLPTTQETDSQNSGEDLDAALLGSSLPTAGLGDENAIDDEDTDQYAIRLSRASSITSLHSRAMISEEGHVHRLGQNLRRDFLDPSFDQSEDEQTMDDAHLTTALREKLDRLHDQQTRHSFETVGTDKAFEELGSTVKELWTIQRQDTEAFQKFRQSQIAAQINSGRPSSRSQSGLETSKEQTSL